MLRSGALLDQITDPIASFTADGAYDQDKVYEDVVEHAPDAAVIVPPRSQQSRALPSKPLRHSGTSTSRKSPNMAAWAGKNPVGTTFGPGSRQQLVDTNA